MPMLFLRPSRARMLLSLRFRWLRFAPPPANFRASLRDADSSLDLWVNQWLTPRTVTEITPDSRTYNRNTLYFSKDYCSLTWASMNASSSPHGLSSASS
jgi:hypothetical protein